MYGGIISEFMTRVPKFASCPPCVPVHQAERVLLGGDGHQLLVLAPGDVHALAARLQGVLHPRAHVEAHPEVQRVLSLLLKV